MQQLGQSTQDPIATQDPMAIGGPAYTQAVSIAALIKQLGLLSGAPMTTPMIPTAAPLIGVA